MNVSNTFWAPENKLTLHLPIEQSEKRQALLIKQGWQIKIVLGAPYHCVNIVATRRFTL